MSVNVVEIKKQQNIFLLWIKHTTVYVAALLRIDTEGAERKHKFS